MKRVLASLIVAMYLCSLTAFAAESSSSSLAELGNNVIQYEDNAKEFDESAFNTASSQPTSQAPQSSQATVDNSTSSAQGSTSSAPVQEKKPVVDYSNGLFADASKPLNVKQDNPAVIAFTQWCGWIVATAMTLFFPLLSLRVVVDTFCILFQPIMLLFSHLPIKLYSSTCEAITQVSQAAKPAGDGTGGAAQSGDVAGIRARMGDKQPLLFYFYETALISFSSLLILLSVVSGLWFKGMGHLSNIIMGMIAGWIG